MDARQGTAGGFPPYVSSNKTPILGLLFGLAAGAAIAPIAAVIYALAIVYIPFVYILFLLTMLFGASIGGVTGLVMHWLKVRNVMVVVLAAFLLGGLGWIASWPPWIWAVLYRADVAISPLDVINPLFLIDAIPSIYETGTWSVGRGSSSAVSGWPLAIVWVIEAGTILLSAPIAAALVSGDRVFCEKCESWCTMLRDQAVYDQSAADEIRDGLAQRGDLSVLASAPRPTEPMEPRRWASLKLGFCPSCGETNVVGLDMIAETVNAKNQTERVETQHMPYVCIGRDQMKSLRESLSASRFG